jgi:hypothetical protein
MQKKRELRMHKLTFLFTVLGTQLLLVFLLIHKSGQFIKESYQKQKLELAKSELVHKKEIYTNQLYACKNPAIIKKFAQTELGMQPVKLSQIKRLPSHETPATHIATEDVQPTNTHVVSTEQEGESHE